MNPLTMVKNAVSEQVKYICNLDVYLTSLGYDLLNFELCGDINDLKSRITVPDRSRSILLETSSGYLEKIGYFISPELEAADKIFKYYTGDSHAEVYAQGVLNLDDVMYVGHQMVIHYYQEKEILFKPLTPICYWSMENVSRAGIYISDTPPRDRYNMILTAATEADFFKDPAGIVSKNAIVPMDLPSGTMWLNIRNNFYYIKNKDFGWNVVGYTKEE
jgi:hypothetical protein